MQGTKLPLLSNKLSDFGTIGQLLAQGCCKSLKNGAPGEIRTPDRLVRSQVLYPTELRARVKRDGIIPKDWRSGRDNSPL